MQVTCWTPGRAKSSKSGRFQARITLEGRKGGAGSGAGPNWMDLRNEKLSGCGKERDEEKGWGRRRRPQANRFLAALVGDPDGVEATFQLIAFVSHAARGSKYCRDWITDDGGA